MSTCTGPGNEELIKPGRWNRILEIGLRNEAM